MGFDGGTMYLSTSSSYRSKLCVLSYACDWAAIQCISEIVHGLEARSYVYLLIALKMGDRGNVRRLTPSVRDSEHPNLVILLVRRVSNE